MPGGSDKAQLFGQATRMVIAAVIGMASDGFSGSRMITGNEGFFPRKTRVLRQRAEETARSYEAGHRTMLSHDEIGDVLHDLRVHQIELEMQNEELNRAQAALEASHARYFDLYDRAPVGYFTISETGLILEANLTGAQLLGAERSDLVNRPFTRFIIGEDQDIYYVHWKRGFETDVPQKCELRMVKNNGTTCWMHLEAGIALSDSGVRVSRVIVSDISVRKQIEHGLRCAQEALEIAHCELQQSLEREKLLSHTDHLTGLYNRRYFYELAVREFDAAIRYRRPLTVFMFDVDRFKRVNDTLGHAFGR